MHEYFLLAFKKKSHGRRCRDGGANFYFVLLFVTRESESEKEREECVSEKIKEKRRVRMVVLKIRQSKGRHTSRIKVPFSFTRKEIDSQQMVNPLPCTINSIAYHFICLNEVSGILFDKT